MAAAAAHAHRVWRHLMRCGGTEAAAAASGGSGAPAAAEVPSAYSTPLPAVVLCYAPGCTRLPSLRQVCSEAQHNLYTRQRGIGTFLHPASMYACGGGVCTHNSCTVSQAVCPTWQAVEICLCSQLLQLHRVVWQWQQRWSCCCTVVLDPAKVGQDKPEQFAVPVNEGRLGVWQEAGGAPAAAAA